MSVSHRKNDGSLRATARWAGAWNVLSAVPDGFAVNAVSKLVVRGDAAATAHNVLRSEHVFRMALVMDLVGLLMFIVSAVLLYELFQPASRRAALLFLVLILMGAVIQSLNALQDLAALTLFTGGGTLAALPAPHADALAMVFLRLHSLGFCLALFFDGCSSLVMAFLVARSTFVPRVIAASMILDGLGFLTYSVSAFLAPSFASRIFPYIPMVTTALGSGVLFLWLIFKSVNVERWQEQAAASARATWT